MSSEELEAIQYLRLLTYVNAATVCLWMYDYFLTFSVEVSVFWRAPWKLPKVLLLLTRYTPFATSGIILYLQFHPAISQETCMLAYEFLLWIIPICAPVMLNQTVTSAILTIRTWAIWESSRRLRIALLLFAVVIWAATFLCVLQIFRSVKIIYVPNTFLWSDCSAVVMSQFLPIFWILVIVFELGLRPVSLILISIKGYQSFNYNQVSGLNRVVYVNGILCYFYVFAFSAINLIIALTVPRNFAGIFMLPEQVLQSILTCRLMFELRRYGKYTVRGDAFSEFTSDFVSPLGTLIFRQAAAAVGRHTNSDIVPDETFRDGNDSRGHLHHTDYV